MVPPPDDPAPHPPSFAHVAADLLQTGQPILFRADGISMRPALKPGDLLRVEPLGDRPPCPGEVILFTNSHGRLCAHRVAACRRLRGHWQVLCAGDGLHGALDAPVPLTSTLGRVTHYQRAGVDYPVTPLRPPLADRLRAAAALADSAGALPGRRHWLAMWRALRQTWNGALSLPAALRSRRLLGPIVRLIWPDMAAHCRVEVTDASSEGQARFLLDAIVRGRSVARRGVHQGFVLEQHSLDWWLSGAYTAPLYRRRGLSRLLLERALELAWEHGAREVFVSIALTNHANQALVARAGFRPVDDLTIGQRLDLHFRERDPHAEPMLVFSVKAGGMTPPA